MRRTSLLDTIRADFAARGWAPADLERFRMEDPPNPPTPPTPPAPTPPAPTPPQPDLGALQKAIDDAKAAGTTEATGSLLKALGFEKLEDAQTWVTSKRDAERAGMDEATRLKAEAEDARKAAEAEKATAAAATVEAAKATFGANLQTFLVQCGVPATALPDASVLVSAELGFATDAAADAVVAATAKVRDRQPALFATAPPPPTPPGRAPGGLPTGQPPAPGGGADPLAAGKARAEAARASRTGASRDDLIRQFTSNGAGSPLAPTS